MTAIPSTAQSDFSAGRPLVDRPSRARRASRSFVRYLIAICVGVAATLAWQSYGEATKQIIAMRAPQLGWSPEAQQMIAGWVQQLGWTKPPTCSGASCNVSRQGTAPRGNSYSYTGPIPD